MIVVVGGQHRKVGKTAAICDLIAATMPARWVAVKISPHHHDSDAGEITDTARFLRAGAAEAHLIEAEPPVELPPGRNLIIESNAIIRQLDPDLLFLVVDPESEDWKPSAEPLRGHARTILVERRIEEHHINLLRSRCIQSA